jgi:hypothetical protein
MASLIKSFGVLMSALYLWALLAQWAMACPCQGHNKPAEPPVETCHRCLAETKSPCCQTQTADCSVVVVDDKPSGKCCESKSGCHHCPRCLTWDAVSPISDKLSATPTMFTAAAQVSWVGVFMSSDYSLLVDRPPDRLRLAPHISTSVLRC